MKLMRDLALRFQIAGEVLKFFFEEKIMVAYAIHICNCSIRINYRDRDYIWNRAFYIHLILEKSY